jgi:hypothetical protein
MSRNWATPSTLNSATAPEVVTMATTIPNGPSLVRSSPMISPIVATPISTVGQSHCPGLSTVSMARSTRLLPSDS